MRKKIDPELRNQLVKLWAEAIEASIDELTPSRTFWLIIGVYALTKVPLDLQCAMHEMVHVVLKRKKEIECDAAPPN